jgi:tRNA dimethylallyltransferase
MESQSANAPLIVVVGQTAAGKSALALNIAERWNGEIIAADSRTIYKGMDIGTAKPSADDRRRVRHHLLDITTPDTPFTANDFKRMALATIDNVISRGRLPILVGGTGLYIDAVLYDFSFRGVFDPAQRTHLAQLPVGTLQAILTERGIALPGNDKNPRHLIRAIEAEGQVGTRRALRGNTLLLGLRLDRDTLLARVTARVDHMLAAGLELEVRRLSEQYGWECVPLQTIGYQEFRSYFEGRLSFDETRQAIITHTMQYAKRQKSWFNRNKSIHWISKTEESVDMLTTFLNK